MLDELMGTSRLLLNLRSVPDDEADEVRELLERHRIEFYETPPNHWGITAGAIWLHHGEQGDEARRLLANYQAERQTRARAEHEEQRRAGTIETIAAKFRRRPFAFTVYLLIIAGLVYFTVRPFFGLGG